MVESSGRDENGIRSTKKYDAAAYDKVSFRLNKGQPFEVALEAAVIEKGEAKSEYVRNALVRKLAKDGFLPPKE